MSNQHRAFSASEITAINVEHMQLMERLQTQTAEQRAFLAKHIASDENIHHSVRQQLLRMLERDGFTLGMFNIHTANTAAQPTVQVTYAIDDDLYAYLLRDDIPRPLRGFLEGGIDMATVSQPTAVDTAPLTGKTR